jgi:hypothetical protein
MLLPSEIQRVEVFVGMEMPTNFLPAAGGVVGPTGAVVGGATGVVEPQALKNTESTSRIETTNIRLFFIFFFSFP